MAAKFDPGPVPPGYVDREIIRITRNGVWMADGEEITHEPTRRLFARSLVKDEKGYFLHIGREMKRIEVEDTAYFVQRAEGSHDEGYTLWLSDETRERLDPKSLAYRPGRLTCRIKGGEEEAKFLHSAYFEILRNLQEDDGHYYLEIGGQRIELARKPG